MRRRLESSWFLIVCSILLLALASACGSGGSSNVSQDTGNQTGNDTVVGGDTAKPDTTVGEDGNVTPDSAGEDGNVTPDSSQEDGNVTPDSSKEDQMDDDQNVDDQNVDDQNVDDQNVDDQNVDDQSTDDQPTADTADQNAPDQADTNIPDPPIVPGTMVLWNPAEAIGGPDNNGKFFDHPFPEMLRMRQDGTINTIGLPNPDTSGNNCADLSGGLGDLGALAGAINPNKFRDFLIDTNNQYSLGFGNNGAIYFRFSGAVKTDSITPASTLDLTSTKVFLINVDDNATRTGELLPVRVTTVPKSAYTFDNMVGIMPVNGFPMEPGALYAAVILRGLNDGADQPLGMPVAFERLKQDRSSTAQEVMYAKVFNYLETKDGTKINRADIAAMTVFRVQNPLSDLAKVAKKIEAVTGAHTKAAVTIDKITEKTNYYELEGTFRNMMFQRGGPPYLPKTLLPIADPPGSFNYVGVELVPDPTDTDGEILADGDVPGNDAEVLDPKCFISDSGTGCSKPRWITTKFFMTIPKNLGDDEYADMPVVLFAHGTGGSRFGIRGSRADTLSALKMATFSIDQVMHDDRANLGICRDYDIPCYNECVKTKDPSACEAECLNIKRDSCNVNPLIKFAIGLEPSLVSLVNPLLDIIEKGTLFFNPLNAHAGKGNVVQSAIDYIWIAHFIKSLTLPAVNLPTIGSKNLGFRADQVHFFGHSQGGLFGPLLAFSSTLKGLVLSAPGGHLASSLLTKIKPVSIKALIAFALCDTVEATIHHPMITMFQTFMEGGDAVNFARYMTFEPVTNAKHVFITEGTDDNYAPPETNEAVTTAALMRQIGPGWVVNFNDNTMTETTTPIEGQLLLHILHPTRGHGTQFIGTYPGDSTPFFSAFKQYDGDQQNGCSDDHFVSTCVPRAGDDWTKFFSDILTGKPHVLSGK